MFNCNDYRKFLESVLNSGGFFGGAQSFSEGLSRHLLLKHDVHNAFDKSIELARIENDLGVTSVFYILDPPHPLHRGRSFNEISEFISKIDNLGHEIGIHCDVHHLMETKSVDLYQAVGGVLSDFSRFTSRKIESINLHGNTKARQQFGSPKAVLRKLKNDSEAIPHKFPAIGKYADLKGFFSLEEFGSLFGLKYWCDGVFFKDGIRIKSNAYLSDNSSRIVCSSIDRNNNFAVDEYSLIGEESINFLAMGRAIFLVHPELFS